MKTVLHLIFLVWMCSCTNKKSSPVTGNKILDFESFTIETPKDWQIFHSRGVDSYVGGILIDSVYIANFDLGLYSSNLSDFVRVNLKDTMYDDVKAGNIPSPDEDYSSWVKKIKKCRVEWDTIDGRPAKILIPIHPGFGVTGIYFDSLWLSNSKYKIRFQLNANNLDSNHEKLLLQAFKTLKFKARQ
ncbi:hypothetical protein [Ferruginibacter sp. SUN106]|uniref:hypothetical protein n=1 Tax=Ferruginibacter sp. SUN106 TaxID=2978348 RepID=UPI003D362474